MPLPPTYKFRSIPALIGLYTKFGMDPNCFQLLATEALTTQLKYSK